MEKLKLAILAQRHSIHTVRWVNGLAERGHEVHLISATDHGDPLNDKVQFHALPIQNFSGYFLNTLTIKGVLEKINPMMLHAHYASGYGTLGRLSGFHPYILSVWGSDVYDFPYKSAIHRYLIQENLRVADWVCSTSHAMAQQTESIYPLENLSVIPFGIDINKFTPQEEYLETSTITIGTVKTLHKKYGIDILIKAFAHLYQEADATTQSKLKLHIVGDGPDRNELIQLAQSSGILEAAQFTDRVAHEDVPKYLNSFDIYVAASRQESFGVAVLEASACAKPVVVSNVGGLPEVVKDNVTGFVVETENVLKFKDKLQTLVNNAHLIHDMGVAGRNYVRYSYDWESNLNSMEDTYQEVISRT